MKPLSLWGRGEGAPHARLSLAAAGRLLNRFLRSPASGLLPRRRGLASLALVAFLTLFTLALSASQGIFTQPDAPWKVSGSLSTSDGRTLSGTLYTTLGKRLSLYDREAKRFVDFSLSDISRIDVSVEEEHEEAVWSWKESGSDEKVFTGQSYPWRKYLTAVTFRDSRVLSGDLDGLVYLEPSPASPAPSPRAPSLDSTSPAPKPNAPSLGSTVLSLDSTAPSLDSTASIASPPKLRFLFHKRHKGEPGQKPSDLLYIKSLIVNHP